MSLCADWGREYARWIPGGRIAKQGGECSHRAATPCSFRRACQSKRFIYLYKQKQNKKKVDVNANVPAPNQVASGSWQCGMSFCLSLFRFFCFSISLSFFFFLSFSVSLSVLSFSLPRSKVLCHETMQRMYVFFPSSLPPPSLASMVGVYSWMLIVVLFFFFLRVHSFCTNTWRRLAPRIRNNPVWSGTSPGGLPSPPF